MSTRSRKGRSSRASALSSEGGGGGAAAGGMAAKYVALLKGCRLCGAGGGYRMPIISSGGGSADSGPELVTKIKECLSVYVNSDDCMPPLICELCLDKVNDFYEFREMCRSTDQRVRSILGLPPQADHNSDDDCILGVSVPIFQFNSKEPASCQPKKSALKKEASKKDKKSKRRERSPTPPPLLTKSSRKRKTAETPPAPVKKLRFKSPPPMEKRSGRHASPPSPPVRKKPAPASKKASVAVPAGASFACEICKYSFKTKKLLKEHQKTSHSAGYWPMKLSCSPCGEWFVTQREADAHHRWHRSTDTYYTCKRCATDFRVVTGYTKHFEDKQCLPESEVPDPLCTICNRHFVTENLLKQHRCSGFGPPGVSMVELNPNNPHLQSLRCMEVRMPRCDGLLAAIKQEPQDYIDIKTEPEDHSYDDFSALDSIKDEPEYSGYEDSGAVADEDYSEEEDEARTIPASNLVLNPFARKSVHTLDSLSVISLRSIFSSPKLLGGMPKPLSVKREPTEDAHSERVPDLSESASTPRLDENSNDQLGSSEVASLGSNVAVSDETGETDSSERPPGEIINSSEEIRNLKNTVDSSEEPPRLENEDDHLNQSEEISNTEENVERITEEIAASNEKINDVANSEGKDNSSEELKLDENNKERQIEEVSNYEEKVENDVSMEEISNKEHSSEMEENNFDSAEVNKILSAETESIPADDNGSQSAISEDDMHRSEPEENNLNYSEIDKILSAEAGSMQVDDSVDDRQTNNGGITEEEVDKLINGDAAVESTNKLDGFVSKLDSAEALLAESELLDDVEVDKNDIIGDEDDLLRDDNDKEQLTAEQKL